MNLNGLHHVTAVSAHIQANLEFYTQVLGLRLVKKTVNQDDVSAYHLFYADKAGSPGTDMTFFDWPVGPERRGTDSISATVFRVDGDPALAYWTQRLSDHGLPVQGPALWAGRNGIAFEDPEGQRLILVDDGGAAYEGELWDGSDVPAPYALRGFHGALLSVPSRVHLDGILTQVLGFESGESFPYPGSPEGELQVYHTGPGGPGRELWVVEEPNLPPARQGAGAVHHIAFRVADETEQAYWRQRLMQAGIGVSNFIDRFYFKSIYFRVSRGILFEIATDGPGFAADEAPETLGRRLALPPFLEPRRQSIEAGLKPLPN